MNKEDLLNIYAQSERIKEFVRRIGPQSEAKRWALKGLTGSAKSLISAALCTHLEGDQLFILRDKEQAAYFYNDLEKLFGLSNQEQAGKNILFFPSSYRRPYEVDNVDNANILQRVEVMNRLGADSRLWVVTYPQALVEKVVAKTILEKNTVKLSVGEQVSQDFLMDFFHEYDFQQTDFVAEAGEFSVRGGIIDVFSFANDSPYRIEFFADKVESIRSFDVVTQLSLEKHQIISLLPDVQQKTEQSQRLSFLSYFSSYSNIWMEDVQDCAQSMEKLYKKADESYTKLGTPLLHRKPEELYEDSTTFLEHLQKFSVIEIGATAYFKHHASLTYDIKAQPLFNKKFEWLVSHIQDETDKGYTHLILSENPKQIQRLERIFFELSSADRPVRFTPLYLSLNEGFIDTELRMAVFTDHQIFERYHRYSIQQKKQDNRQALSLKELYELKPGDFISHIDHGVGRFAGLEKIKVNGREQEAICLVYKDNDMLHISIHALHKMSRFSSKDGNAPSLHRLGGNAWKTLKQKTKQRVKDIAKDLIKLYAQRKASKGMAYSADSYLQHELESSFFYEDTPDQLKATQDVKADMESLVPMDRLVCGDVGFGKTEVAIRAAFKAVVDGKQVAVLVPTTVLAYQHAKTFAERLENLPCRIDYLNRFRSTKEKKEVLQALNEGKIDILIGTHRILSKDVIFKDLGLLIVDEEQKFGVGMKEKLKQIKINLDTLTLTATPIPRTLQFSLMGARDLSIINTPPANRYPVQTEIHPFGEEIVRDAIVHELNRGGQVFFVHHRVQNIMEVAGMLQRLVPDAKIAVAHGQMEGEKLEEILLGFIEGAYDVLVSTKIVENGLDIANANTMLVNEAQNYGLSELHQLRGRVGRSNKKAYCYLLTPPSYMLSDDAKKRLRAIEEFSDIGSGFQIAMRDLDIRGAGNILGGEQSGFISEIGMDMYQKILDEAIQELKETEFRDLYADENSVQNVESKDCQIETDLEILIPDQYVSSIRERLSLYKELDSLDSDEQLANFAAQLRDRFGEIPHPTLELIETVRLRKLAKQAGFDKLGLRADKMNLQIAAAADTAYFQSDVFGRILAYVQANPKTSSLKQKGERLSISIENIKEITEAMALLKSIIL